MIIVNVIKNPRQGCIYQSLSYSYIGCIHWQNCRSFRSTTAKHLLQVTLWSNCMIHPFLLIFTTDRKLHCIYVYCTWAGRWHFVSIWLTVNTSPGSILPGRTTANLDLSANMAKRFLQPGLDIRLPGKFSWVDVHHSASGKTTQNSSPEKKFFFQLSLSN